MTQISYMPGCTLKTSGKNFETSALKLLERLDVRAEELEEWFCCGTTYSLASDNLMMHLAPIRTLVRAKETGQSELLVLCAMCYNTLRRAQLLVQQDSEKRDKINEFMYTEETAFQGDELKVVHLLSFLRDSVGLDKLREAMALKESGLKVAPYYGCMLLRPREVSIDASSETPAVMEDVLETAGVNCVYFPFKTECCGSFQTVNEKAVVESRTKAIAGSAVRNGADAIATSCPLCAYNLDAYQAKLAEKDPGFRTIPVLYVTQILALCAGIEDENDWSLHAIDPRPMLEAKGLLSGVSTG